MNDLEQQAANTSVHVVWYVYVDEDPTSGDVTRGVPVAIHKTKAAASADASARREPPPLEEVRASGRYVCDEPCNLLAFVRTFYPADTALLETVLRGHGAPVEPQVCRAPGTYRPFTATAPLLADEHERACGVEVWIYYADHFHAGDARQSFPVAIRLTAAEAHAELERRGRLEPGFDGHVVTGPAPLVVTEAQTTSDVGADVIREVLRRQAAGEPGPVPIAP